eukprot:13944866-Alexandrium_andersonii.AAC.1
MSLLAGYRALIRRHKRRVTQYVLWCAFMKLKSGVWPSIDPPQASWGAMGAYSDKTAGCKSPCRAQAGQ